jgi:hypothetical protein
MSPTWLAMQIVSVPLKKRQRSNAFNNQQDSVNVVGVLLDNRQRNNAFNNQQESVNTKLTL